MELSRLDYMTNGIEWDKRQKLIDMMYPNDDGMFNFIMRKFLKDPYTTDEDKLLAIPNSDQLENVERARQQYRQHFAKINQMCIENGIYPFFKDPNDLADCEKMREYLIRKWPEKILNKHFGVNSFYKYKPPVYVSNMPNPQNPLGEGK